MSEAARANRLRRQIRIVISVFIVCLVLSGLTAFALRHELEWLTQLFGVPSTASPESYTGLKFWLVTVREGLRETYDKYPFMAYGTDWLALAHIVIAIFFIGPLIDPVRNRWIITSGMIACGLVVLLAIIAGPLRGIPFYWRMIDCSFGVVGMIPLWLCQRYIRELAALESRGAVSV